MQFVLLQREYLLKNISSTHYRFLPVEKVVVIFELNESEPFEEVFEDP